jgi:hypothetical protein
VSRTASQAIRLEARAKGGGFRQISFVAADALTAATEATTGADIVTGSYEGFGTFAFNTTAQQFQRVSNTEAATRRG